MAMAEFNVKVMVFSLMISSLILFPSTNADSMELLLRESKFHLPGMQTRHAQVFNNMTDGSSFAIHCVSKDDDMGVHNTGHNEWYELKIKPNIWGSTLFHCRVRVGKREVAFDVYNHNRDNNRCPKFCRWYVLGDGVHGYKQGGVAQDQFFPFP